MLWCIYEDLDLLQETGEQASLTHLNFLTIYTDNSQTINPPPVSLRCYRAFYLLCVDSRPVDQGRKIKSW